MAGKLDNSNETINRIIGQRVKKSEREVARRYAQTLNELRAMLGAIYQSYEADGVLTFEEMAKFDRLQKLFRDIDFLLDRNFRDIYPAVYDAIGWSYAQSYDLTAWAIEQDTKVAQISASAEAIKAAVEAPIDKLTLNQRLQLQRQSILVAIRQEITIGLISGASYKTMADGIKGALEQDATKAMRVIRTEAHRVQEGAKHSAADYADKQGVRMVKTWNSSQDSRVRHRPKNKTDHKMLDGETLPVDEDFRGVKGKGPAPGQLGHASEDINCRCFLTYSIVTVEKLPYNTIQAATFDKWRQEKAS